MLLQFYYITDSPLYQYSLPTISTTTLFVKPTGLSILKHSISFRWPIQIAYSSYLYGPLFICDCLPSLFLSFLLFYRYFVNPARKASLTDSVRFFPSSSAILRSALSISRSRKSNRIPSHYFFFTFFLQQQQRSHFGVPLR